MGKPVCRTRTDGNGAFDHGMWQKLKISGETGTAAGHSYTTRGNARHHPHACALNPLVNALQGGTGELSKPLSHKPTGPRRLGGADCVLAAGPS